MRVLALVQQLGVQWTRREQERRLFPLCVQVQAELRRRHGDTYRTPDVSQVPEAYTEEALAILSEACREHSGPTGVTQSLPPA